MGFSLVGLSCALVAFSGQGKSVYPQYRLRYPSLAAEQTPADSRGLVRNAEYLLARPPEWLALIREARSGDSRRAQAARLILLGSGEVEPLAVLLDRTGMTDPLAWPIAMKAVDMHPREAWPHLRRRARAGIPAAFHAIARYAEVGEPELAGLARNSNARVRAEAIRTVGDLKTVARAVDDPSDRVQRSAIERLLMSGEFDVRTLLRHRRTSVRALAAELSQVWTQKDFPLWIGLASDPSPRVRKWAVLQLAPLGLEWGNGPWTGAGIEAVGRALAQDAPEVRGHAVLTVRSWMLEWPKIHGRWSAGQIRRAREIFRHPNFRDAVYRQALGEIRSGTPGDTLGIQIVPAFEALALSGDPRTLGVFRRAIGSAPWNRTDWIKALGHVPGRATVDTLFDLIDLAARRPAPGENVANDYEADQVFGFAASALRQLGVRDYARATAHVRNPRLAPALRLGIATAIASADSGEVFRSLRDFARDGLVPEYARVQVVYALGQSPRPEAGAFLERWGREAPTEALQGAAQGALRGRERSEQSRE